MLVDRSHIEGPLRAPYPTYVADNDASQLPCLRSDSLFARPKVNSLTAYSAFSCEWICGAHYVENNDFVQIKRSRD